MLGRQGRNLPGDVDHQLAKPPMGWVFGEARVPDHRDGVLGDVEGYRARCQHRRGGTFAEARRCGEDEIAPRSDLSLEGQVREWKISRKGVAQFLALAAHSPDYVGQSVALSGAGTAAV